MQIITKNIRWRALMEIYQTAKFDRSPNNLSWDIVSTDWWQEKKDKKRIRKAKTIDLHLYADLTSNDNLTIIISDSLSITTADNQAINTTDNLSITITDTLPITTGENMSICHGMTTCQSRSPRNVPGKKSKE